jgi:penicillin-binding protein 1A
MKIFKYLGISFIVCALLGVIGAVVLYNWAAKDLPGFKNITDYNPPLVTTVYAKNDEILGYFYKEKRFLVTLDQMSHWIPKAFLAAEDASFYQHEGVDLTAISRAFVINMKAGKVKQGGSTITQQIIKRLLLTNERSYERKLKEAILAYRLERYLTKDEILTIYLNEIYLGAHSFGVEAAARSYFGKHAKDLTIAEAALLAGLPKAPSRYNPYENPHLARKRQMYVLGQMLVHGWITQEQYDEAVAEELEFTSMPEPSWKVGPYYLEEVRRWLIDRFGEDVTYNGGLTVTTSCDIKHQKAADAALKRGLENSAQRRGWTGPIDNISLGNADEILKDGPQEREELSKGQWVKSVVTGVKKNGASVRFGKFEGFMPLESMWWVREPNSDKSHEQVPNPTDARKVLKKGDVIWASILKVPEKESKPVDLALERRPEVEGAIVSMDPKSGKVLALSGGYSFSRSQFNRATQARRQCGSAFKPFVYSTAIDNGFTPASIVMDSPIVFANEEEGKLWRPENFANTFKGPTLLRTALVKSKNTCTIRVAQELGIRKIIERARSMGLDSEFPADLSVALGSASVTLMNMVQAYSAFARDGSYIKPRMVLSVKSAWGDEMYTSEPEAVEAISPQTAYIMASLMKQVVSDGTGWRARALKRPIAGKTGTTNNEQDAWFMGYTPYLVTGVFVGFDEIRPMGRWETGSRAASPIWVQYRKEVEEDYPYQDFPQPQGIVMAKVDAKTGKLAGPNSEESYFLPFKEGTQPTEMAGGTSESGEEGTSAGDDLFKQIF